MPPTMMRSLFFVILSAGGTPTESKDLATKSVNVNSRRQRRSGLRFCKPGTLIRETASDCETVRADDNSNTSSQILRLRRSTAYAQDKLRGTASSSNFI